MDPAQVRERMGKLIAEESTGLAQLSEMLEHEHDLLAAGDVAGLTAAIKERQRCVVRITRVDEERRSICRALSFPLDAQGLEGCCAGAIRMERCPVAGPNVPRLQPAAALSTIATARSSPLSSSTCAHGSEPFCRIRATL